MDEVTISQPGGINADVARALGWEFITVGYFGDPETETPRQVQLESWLSRVGVESVGDYWIDVEDDFWMRSVDWNPVNKWEQVGNLIKYYEISLVHDQLKNRWHASGLSKDRKFIAHGYDRDPRVAVCLAFLERFMEKR